MLRRLAFATVLCSLAATTTALAGYPVVRHVMIDQRPIDRVGGIAVMTDGAVYIDVIDITRTFSGLLLFGRGSVQVDIGGATAVFTVGKRIATVRSHKLRLPVAPFLRNGDIYVPLKVITDLAGAVLVFDPRRTLVNVTTAPSLGHGGDVIAPIAASDVLQLKPSADIEGDGLHLKLLVTNVSSQPYQLTFPSGARVAFVVSRDGAPVWNSTKGLRYTESRRIVSLVAGASVSYEALWSGFAASGPGRYLSRATLLDDAPIAAAPLSIGVVTPEPTHS